MKKNIKNNMVLFSGAESEIANRIPVTNTAQIFGEEIAYKITHLAQYHEIDARSLLEHLVTSAYIEAENAGNVPVDPWNRNPNSDSRDENNPALFHQFPEFLRDLHIPHTIDRFSDEDGNFIEIWFLNSEAGVSTFVMLHQRYAWDDDLSAFVQGKSDRFEITVWNQYLGRETTSVTHLKGIKTVKQLAEKVGLTI